MENISPELMAYLGTNIGVELAKGKTLEEINCIKQIVNQIAATLSTIACQQLFLKSNTTSNKNNDK